MDKHIGKGSNSNRVLFVPIRSCDRKDRLSFQREKEARVYLGIHSRPSSNPYLTCRYPCRDLRGPALAHPAIAGAAYFP